MAGDPIAAQDRLAFLDGVPLLAVTPEIEQLADAIMKSLQIPQKAALATHKNVVDQALEVLRREVAENKTFPLAIPGL